MALLDILAGIDREIALLQRARALLSQGTAVGGKRKAGRPRKSSLGSATPPASPAKKKVRQLTPEGRKKIAEAVKRRWAAQRKAAATTK